MERTENKKYVLAYFNQKKSYNPYDCFSDDYIEKRIISSLFGAAYFLKANCILTNKTTNLEPKIYDAKSGSAYFQDGYAFYIKDQSMETISYVTEFFLQSTLDQQLHPYGKDPLLPETITEEQILNLQFYVRDNLVIERDIMHLPKGFKLSTGNIVYTIHNFLENGGYGYTYTAEEKNLNTGACQEVVIKEYFPNYICIRSGEKIELKQQDLKSEYNKGLEHFKAESKIMHKLGSIENGHIALAYNNFHNDETNTDYYVMPYYKSGSIMDSLNKGEEYTESIIINQIVRPMCKALHIVHHHHILHLDIKLDNMMIDEDGNAILIDFGMANQYDENGHVIYRSEERKQSTYVAPELQNANMSKFAPGPDIYGLASALYEFVTYEQAEAIYSYGDTDKKLAKKMRTAHCSQQFIEAVLQGLQAYPEGRPATMEDFLHLFPGCEDVIL